MGLFDFVERVLVKHKIKHRYFGGKSYKNGFQKVLREASLENTEK